ncbi:MAG: M24 family metallopeptidase [Candidatus Pacebacteria bacterium]|nr:M24 family metallopeptidase [Candidatus Paceibacterota bacterium]
MQKYILPVVQEIRAKKSKTEIAHIVRAQQMCEEILAFAIQKLKVGVTEIEIAKFIVSEMKKRGVTALAFSPIVAFGKGSADIHHEPGKVKLKKGDFVMFDFGATWQGYCSDMTRTYVYGTTPTKKQQRLYCTVLASQMKVLRALESGERSCKKLDTLARSYLAKHYKDNFKHGLGHGVGTAIHEWPNFKPNTTDILEEGMVMTVEPGVYLKGYGGVRIEDMVLITKSGAKNLTHAPKSLGDVTIGV